MVHHHTSQKWGETRRDLGALGWGKQSQNQKLEGIRFYLMVEKPVDKLGCCFQAQGGFYG